MRASAEPFAGAYSFVDGELIRIWRAKAGTLPFPWCGTPGQVAARDLASGTVTVLTGRDVLILQEVETELKAENGPQPSFAPLGSGWPRCSTRHLNKNGAV